METKEPTYTQSDMTKQIFLGLASGIILSATIVALLLGSNKIEFVK